MNARLANRTTLAHISVAPISMAYYRDCRSIGSNHVFSWLRVDLNGFLLHSSSQRTPTSQHRRMLKPLLRPIIMTPLYKSIVIELIQQDHPTLYEQLRSNRTLGQALNDYAIALRASYLAWLEELKEHNPRIDPSLLSTEALEMALQELMEALPSEPTTGEPEGLSLDDAMSHLRRRSASE